MEASELNRVFNVGLSSGYADKITLSPCGRQMAVSLGIAIVHISIEVLKMHDLGQYITI
jgi:hypothetical protein